MTEIIPINTFEKRLIDFFLENICSDSTTSSIISSTDKIVLDYPNDEKGSLSLFLYEIKENTFLKNQPLPKPDYSIKDSIIKNNPLYCSLFYLITPTTGNTLNDHILLSKILQIIHDNPVLYFKDDNEKVMEKFNLIWNYLSIEEMNNLWSIVSNSNPFKLSISLEISPFKIESLITKKPGRPVKKRRIKIKEKEEMEKIYLKKKDSIKKSKFVKKDS